MLAGSIYEALTDHFRFNKEYRGNPGMKDHARYILHTFLGKLSDIADPTT